MASGVASELPVYGRYGDGSPSVCSLCPVLLCLRGRVITPDFTTGDTSDRNHLNSLGLLEIFFFRWRSINISISHEIVGVFWPHQMEICAIYNCRLSAPNIFMGIWRERDFFSVRSYRNAKRCVELIALFILTLRDVNLSECECE